jgi:hypothetical protein
MTKCNRCGNNTAEYVFGNFQTCTVCDAPKAEQPVTLSETWVTLPGKHSLLEGVRELAFRLARDGEPPSHVYCHTTVGLNGSSVSLGGGIIVLQVVSNYWCRPNLVFVGSQVVSARPLAGQRWGVFEVSK